MEQVVIDVLANGFTLAFAGYLIEPKMDTAIDPSVGNIIGNGS